MCNHTHFKDGEIKAQGGCHLSQVTQLIMEDRIKSNPKASSTLENNFSKLT